MEDLIKAIEGHAFIAAGYRRNKKKVESEFERHELLLKSTWGADERSKTFVFKLYILEWALNGYAWCSMDESFFEHNIQCAIRITNFAAIFVPL